MVRDRLAGPAVTTGDERIDENFVRNPSQVFGPAQVGHHRRDRLGTSDPEGANESEMAEREEVFGGFLSMELDNPDSGSIGQGRHFVGRPVDEQPDHFGRAW